MSSTRPGCFLLTAVIAAFSAGCADDATRIERAREHQHNADYRAAIIELKNVLQSDSGNIEARALLGEISLQNGDSATAVKELRRAQELGGAPGQYTVVLARALLRESRYREVVELNPELLSNSDDRAMLLALIGTAQLGLSDQQAAERNFSVALELVPDQPDALIGNSRLASERGDLGAAEAGIMQVLQSRPGDPDSLAALARLQQARGDFALAEENFNKALEGIKDTGRVLERMQYMSGLMEAMLSQNKTTQAQALGSKMIEMTSQHPLALFHAGRADYAAGNYDGAINKAERIITLIPSAESPRMLIAGAAVAKGDTALAVKHLQAAVNINPGNEEARKLLANARMEMGDADEALKLLEPLMVAGTKDAQLLAMAGAASIRSGNPDAGVELMERSIVAADSDPAFVIEAAANFLAAGEVDRAVEVLESLPELDLVGQREFLLVLALLRKGDQDAARAKAQSIVNNSPDAPEARRLMGGFHLAVGEWDKARSEFEKALELNPDDIAAVLNLARIDVKQQKPKQAEDRFGSLLDSHPGNLMALTALAQLAEARGDTEASIEFFEQARTANPGSVEPPLRLGQYYIRAGNLVLAEERANQAVRVAPSNGMTHSLLGTVLLQDERYAEAIGHFERAITLPPVLARTYYQFGRALAASGQDEASYAAYVRAVEIDKTFYPARGALTMAAVDRGDFNKALSIAESLVADYPDRGEPLNLKAHVQTARNDLKGALETYEKAAVILPSSEIAAKVYAIQKHMGVYQPWNKLEQWVAANPDDASARSLLATAYMESGLTDQAIESLEQVMATAPNVSVAMSLAQANVSLGDVDTAIAWLQKAVALKPAEIPARAALASLELQRGNASVAMKVLRDLRRNHPSAMELDVLEGEILLANGDYSGSIDAFDRALETRPSEATAMKRYRAGKGAGQEDAWQVLETWFADHPEHINVGMELAQIYSSREWHKEAVEAYRKVLAADPDNAFALNNIAWAYIERGNEGDLKRGLAAASQAYQQQPKLAAIGDTYGWILLKDGQNQRAAEILGVAASSANAHPEIIYHHAVALDALGRDAEAIALLNRLLAGGASFEGREQAEVLRRRLSP